MNRSIVFLCFAMTSQVFASTDLLENINKVAEHAAKQETTIERFDRNFYRKEGFIILKERNSELTQLHGQLLNSFSLMTSELGQLKNENSRLEFEVEQLESDKEELLVKINE